MITLTGLYELIKQQKAVLEKTNSEEMAALRAKLGLEYPEDLANVTKNFIEKLTAEYKARGGKRPV